VIAPLRWKLTGNLSYNDTLDLSMNRFDLFSKGVTPRVGIQNLLDNDYVALNQSGYDENLRQSGRAWWMQLR